MSDFSGRVVLVTGGGSGIGAASARLAAARGAAVAVVDRDGAHARAVANDVRGGGGRAIDVELDVTDDAAVGEAVERTCRELGRLNGLVTAAGIFHGPDMQPMERIGIDDFFHLLHVNLGGTFSAVRHAIGPMSDGGGAITTIASTAAIRGHGFGAGYTASKGGVDALTRLIAVQCGPRGIRANCVCPGGTITAMTGDAFAAEAARERAKRSIPLGRYAEADDIADVAVWLLSDSARYVTGQTFPVEGGSTVA